MSLKDEWRPEAQSARLITGTSGIDRAQFMATCVDRRIDVEVSEAAVKQLEHLAKGFGVSRTKLIRIALESLIERCGLISTDRLRVALLIDSAIAARLEAERSARRRAFYSFRRNERLARKELRDIALEHWREANAPQIPSLDKAKP